MSKLKFPVIAVAILGLVNSCHQSGESGSYHEESLPSDTTVLNSAAESVTDNSEAPLSSTAATYENPSRKFIRTANLSMEVENVYQSTTKIESKISQLGGFVTKSMLNSRILSRETFPVNSDSSLEVKKYTVSNEMTVRVPQKELGNFLNSLGEEIKFLYFRNISADDVSLNCIAAELEKERLNSTNKQLDKLNGQNGKITDKQNVVSNMDENKSEVNYQKISTLKMKDEVAFSTVSLLIQEKEKIAETMVINPKNYEDKYRPHFLYRARISVTEGFHFFQTICIGLLYIWPVWLIAVLIYLLVKFQVKKTKIS